MTKLFLGTNAVSSSSLPGVSFLNKEQRIEKIQNKYALCALPLSVKNVCMFNKQLPLRMNYEGDNMVGLAQKGQWP